MSELLTDILLMYTQHVAHVFRYLHADKFTVAFSQLLKFFCQYKWTFPKGEYIFNFNNKRSSAFINTDKYF